MTDETLTVKEFKMWLMGVEDLMPEDWTPTADQWVKIRAKIDQIAEAQPVPQSYIPAPRVGYSNQMPPIPYPIPEVVDVAVPVGPSMLDMPAMPAAPSQLRSTQSGMPVNISGQQSDQIFSGKTPNGDQRSPLGSFA